MLLLLRKYHPHISTHFHLQNHPKNILLLIRERITKNISVFPYEINAQVILLLPLAILSQEMSALKKREEEKKWGNKKGQVPGTSKEKSETRGKNGQVSDSRIRGTRYPPEKKKEEEHLILHKKFQKSKKGMYPLKRAKVELDIHHYYDHHHHTSFIRHTCTSWFDLLTCFFGSMVWLCNKCLVSMYILPPTYELQISNLIRVGWEKRQCHYALYHKYYIFWEKAYTITALVRIQKYHKRAERVIQGISEFYLKIYKNSRAIADQEQETWHLARPFYLLTTQDRSDGYKSHGDR